jgi:hypothetical protein
MALITKPTTPEKGEFQNYGLNQSDLISLISDVYFQDRTNWQKVILTYVSTVSNQLSIISFTPSEVDNEITALGFFATEARDIFQLSNISIYDKQNGRLRFERSQIPSASSYDVDFSPPPIDVVYPFSATLKSDQSILSNINYTATSTDTGGYASMVYPEVSTDLVEGKFYKEFTVNSTGPYVWSTQYYGIRFFNNQPSYFTPYGGSAPLNLPDNEFQVYMQRGVTLYAQESLNAPFSQLYGTQEIVSGDVIGICIDADDPDKGMYFSINGVFLNSANPATGAGKVNVKSIFPGLPDSYRAFFFFQNMALNQISINEEPLYLPSGYRKI